MGEFAAQAGRNSHFQIHSSRIPARTYCARARSVLRSWGLLLAGLASLGAASPLGANGFGESGSWGFRTSTDELNRTNIATMIAKEQAGGYGPGDTFVTYDVKGDINNCNLNATAIGNTGSNTQDAPIGSPDLNLDSAVNADSSANDSTNANTGGDTDASNTPAGMVDSAIGIGDTVTQSPSNDTALNSTQTNTGSQLTTIGTVDNEYAVAGVSGTGGDGQANLNATQTVSNTDLTSSVQGSSACQFQDMTGNLASPINAVTTMSNQ